MRRRRRRLRIDEEPLLGVANLFDLAIVIVIGLVLAILTAYKLTDFLSPKSEITILKKNKGKIEIIVKKGKTVKIYRGSGTKAEGIEGEKIGTAYKLKDGRVIYVPE
ncbi:DUF2149 domain-containing protein [Thermosulfidibacter takaii]|uniref:DUF2149 domain-containing protein n=1 Tax=Thermosulfidibacter takaii TaxID=412593 RepID=UPI0018D4D3AC|nr:DUF2149 domain-containing protein [Thermosulfidibacter takaii]